MFRSSRKKKEPPPTSSSLATADPSSDASKKAKKKDPKFKVDPSDPFYSMVNGWSFIIRGKPLPQQRNRWGKGGHIYPPSKKDQAEFNSACQELFASKEEALPRIADKVIVTMELRYAFPYKFGGEQNLWSHADIDNLCKFTLDALGHNKTFYHDDRQVKKVQMEKCFDNRYGSEGFTRVKVFFKRPFATDEVISIGDSSSDAADGDD